MTKQGLRFDLNFLLIIIKILDNSSIHVYIICMRRICLISTCIALIGFVGIQFAAVIDDPHHLIEPDPDCPICLAAKTQVCTTPQISISYTPDIVLYLVEMATQNQEKVNNLSTLAIRAPPVS